MYVLEGGINAWNAGGQVIMPKAKTKPKIAPYPKDLPIKLEHPPVREYKIKINLTLDQLAEFDGLDGRPAYVAANSIIYDLTSSRLWRGGEHDPGHGKIKAGQDLTGTLFNESPHGMKNLDRYPVVGNLIK